MLSNPSAVDHVCMHIAQLCPDFQRGKLFLVKHRPMAPVMPARWIVVVDAKKSIAQLKLVGFNIGV